MVYKYRKLFQSERLVVMLLILKVSVFRSSHRRCSMKKGVLRNFTKFRGKRLCQSLFFNKVAGLRPATLLKKRLWHRCFPVNFAKFLRTPFSQNTSGRLLLCVQSSRRDSFIKLALPANPISCQCSISIPPENARKRLVF